MTLRGCARHLQSLLLVSIVWTSRATQYPRALEPKEIVSFDPIQLVSERCLVVQQYLNIPSRSICLARHCFQQDCVSLSQIDLDQDCPESTLSMPSTCDTEDDLLTMLRPLMPMMKSNQGSICTSGLLFLSTWKPAGLRALAFCACGSASRREMKRLIAPNMLILSRYC